MYRKYAKAALWAVGLLTLIFIFFIKNLSFNYNFESFFPTGDPDLDYYMEFREVFENDNDYLLIGLTKRPSLFDRSFLTKVKQLKDSLRLLDHVVEVISPLDIKKPVIGPISYFEVPLFHPDLPEKYATDSTLIYTNVSLPGNLVSKDATVLTLVLKHAPQITKPDADSLAAEVQRLCDNFGFQESHVAGKAKAQGVYIDKMKNELLIFLSASIILVILFLTFAYRSLWGVILPLCVVLLSVIWILGLMGAMNKPLDILMVLLPTIMFVVGMSDVVHIMTKYIEELRMGEDKVSALNSTLKEVGLATFLTSLTTAVGFFTLLTASIRPIREFGLYTGIGVFIAYAVAFSLLPAILFLMKRPKIAAVGQNRNRWFAVLGLAFTKVLRWRWYLVAFSTILIAVSLYGINLLQVNTYLIEDIPDNDPLKQDFLFFDRHFGGSRPFEMTVRAVPENMDIFSPPVLAETEKVLEYTTANYGTGSLLSPVMVVKELHQALKGGSVEAYRLPADSKDYKKVNRHLKRLRKNPRFAELSAKEGKLGRISGRVPDMGSAITLANTKDLYRYIDKNIDSTLVEFKVTGTSNLIDKNNEYLSQNMLQGLAIAFIVIAIIAGLLFRSLRMILVTLVPNIIPLLIVGGVMGYFGITLKLSTSIIFTIAFGIAVDDTIHFISKLKLELQKGRSLLYALKRAYLSTGKAIIITTIILSGGFLTLVLSDFGGTFYTGLLVSLTLFLAMVIDLTLLPALVFLFHNRKR